MVEKLGMTAPPLEQISEQGTLLGFDLVGVTSTIESRHMDLYRRWLGEDRHGKMSYLSRGDAVRRREDLSLTMESVRSVVVVAHEYFRPDPPGVPDDVSRGVIARYARGADYHDIVKARLLQLHEWIQDQVGGPVGGYAYVDTGPILERELAQRVGLGWFGKNTMLINPGKGSYFFLGILLLDLDLPSSEPFLEDHCGSCTRCLEACPTDALLGRDENGAPVMDATRCISYLTIELKGAIPIELRPLIGNRIYGCDICQEVCPWNRKFATRTSEEAYLAQDGLDGPSLVEWMGMGEEEFRERFRKSPIKRTKRRGLLRNVAVALGNWGAPEAVPALVKALDDAESLVRGHAVWALGKIGGEEALAALRARFEVEGDEWVREEIQEALRR